MKSLTLMVHIWDSTFSHLTWILEEIFILRVFNNMRAQAFLSRIAFPLKDLLQNYSMKRKESGPEFQLPVL